MILGLLKPDSGAIQLNGERIDRLNEEELTRVRGDIGMLFQESALFDSLTVAENVGYRLFEETDMPEDQVYQRVQEVLGFIGMSSSRPDAIRTVGRAASAGRHRPCDGRTPAPAVVR